jgi:hypothetical protein
MYRFFKDEFFEIFSCSLTTTPHFIQAKGKLCRRTANDRVWRREWCDRVGSWFFIWAIWTINRERSVLLGESRKCNVVYTLTTVAPLAQLDRASGYEPEGREFESLRAHHLPLNYFY